MQYMDFINQGLGAIVGFALAQTVSIGRLLHDTFMKPRLKIEDDEPYLLLSHTTQISSGEAADERYFGFTVRNKGRRIATGVRFQILSMRFLDEKKQQQTQVMNTALDLSIYGNSDHPCGDKQATLVPGAGVTVALGWLREDYDTVIPLADNIPDYYEEICRDASEYEFEVVAFNDRGDFVTSTIKISPWG